MTFDALVLEHGSLCAAWRAARGRLGPREKVRVARPRNVILPRPRRQPPYAKVGQPAMENDSSGSSRPGAHRGTGPAGRRDRRAVRAPRRRHGCLLDLIRDFDARGGWNTGFRSCAAWLSWRVGLDLGAAREKVRVARALGTLPLLAQALGRGELSYAKVRALTRVATPETEERLLAVGRAGTAAHVERIVRGWRRVDRQAEARETKRQHTSRALHVYPDEDGMVVLRGRLTPEVGALLLQALDAARETLYQRGRRQGPPVADLPADPPTLGQQQADALALLAETALHHGLDPGAPGERYQVVVHVDAQVLADPAEPGQSVLEGGAARFRGTRHVAIATPRRPETQYDRAWRVQRSITLLVPTEPVAEPDPGRCEVPHRVATARAVSTHQETLP